MLLKSSTIKPRSLPQHWNTHHRTLHFAVAQTCSSDCIPAAIATMFSSIYQATGSASVAMMPLVAIGFVSLSIVIPSKLAFIEALN